MSRIIEPVSQVVLIAERDFTVGPSCVHNDEFECATCTDERHADEHPDHVDGCRVCKFSSLLFDPRIGMATRGRKTLPIGTVKSKNSWERGLAKDERGMPLLTMSGRQITVKEAGERRHELDAARHRARNDPHAFDAWSGNTQGE